MSQIQLLLQIIIRWILLAKANSMGTAQGETERELEALMPSMLALYCGLTDEEFDFIINYDIKYRMGKDEE